MANLASAEKRARQAEKRRKHNAAYRSMLRTHIKKMVAAIASKDRQLANEAFKRTTSVIDKAANKGLIHKNKADRHKHRLNVRLRAL